MRILRKEGLENPRIECMVVTSTITKVSKTQFKLVCDNYTESKLLSKKYSFFEEKFNDYLFFKKLGLIEELEKAIKKEENENAEQDTVSNIIISYIEDSFAQYLKDTQEQWKKDLKIQNAMIFDFKWKKASSPSMLKSTQEDKDNKAIFFCLIPEALSGLITKGCKGIETRAINALFSEKHYDLRPNIYYFYVNNSSLEVAKIHPQIKEHLKNGEAVLYFLPTIEENESFKKIVYLYKSLFIENE